MIINYDKKLIIKKVEKITIRGPKNICRPEYTAPNNPIRPPDAPKDFKWEYNTGNISPTANKS